MAGLAPVPLLFLFADSGGGHRRAAQAVGEALEALAPGRFIPVLIDPLSGAGSAALIRWVTRLYGPVIRRAPWGWGAVYRASDSRSVMGLLRSSLLALADRPVARAAAAWDPGAIVSFHPLTGHAGLKAKRRAGTEPLEIPIVTVVTDLATTHTAWRDGRMDRVVVPTAAARWRCHLDGLASDRCVEVGLPVTSAFWTGPIPAGERGALRRSLGVDERPFLVVIAGGAEGSGGIAARASALVRQLADISVVAICGRNRRLERRLARSAAASRGLIVKGFVDDMADWMHAADVVVTKAGPGMIAEAACCGTPLVLTSHIPGQEEGNIDLVVDAGAGRHAPDARSLVAAIDRLRRHPDDLAVMRVAALRMSRPDAAIDIATLVARLARPTPASVPRRAGQERGPSRVTG